MRQIIFTSIIAIVAILLASCNNQQKEQERLKFVQDSIKIDNAFQSQIASLTKSIDSLLPFSERKKFREDMNKGYREMVSEAIKERKAELNFAKADYNLSLEVDISKSVKSELERNGYGQRYLEEEYNDWARMRSKNPMMQQFLEEKLSDIKWKYQNFKDGIK